MIPTSAARSVRSIHERAITDPTVVCGACILGRHASCTTWARALFGRRRSCNCAQKACAARRARSRAAGAVA